MRENKTKTTKASCHIAQPPLFIHSDAPKRTPKKEKKYGCHKHFLWQNKHKQQQQQQKKKRTKSQQCNLAHPRTAFIQKL